MGEASNDIRFRDVAESAGLAWTYQNGEERDRYSILEQMGGGVGLVDFDIDGLLDVVAAGGGDFPDERSITGRPMGFFRQTPHGRFHEVSQPARVISQDYYTHGVAACDYDHDGFPDIAVTGYGGLSLFRNQGDGTLLQEHRGQAPFQGGWSTTAGWGDVNADGNPDLVAVHYADWSFENDPVCPGPPPHHRDVCQPRRFHGLPDQLFLSDGAGGFHEASRDAGLTSIGKSIGLVVSDLDLDGDLDVYVTNDTDPNHLYRNDGTGHFEEMGVSAGVALGADGNSDGSMGVDAGDFNLDGLPDLWVTNFERENFALYQNLGALQFAHVSRRVGIGNLPATYVGWGTVMLDAEGDGDEDLFVTNGHVVRYPSHSTVRQRPVLLANSPGSRFHNVADSVGDYFLAPHRGRGVAMGDLDGDGDPDLVVSHVNEPLALLTNEAPAWKGIALRLIGTRSPRQPIGAIVRLDAGDRVVTKQCKLAASYASTSAETLFFALGRRPACRIEIEWPAGTKQIVIPVPVQSHLTIIEPP